MKKHYPPSGTSISLSASGFLFSLSLCKFILPFSRRTATPTFATTPMSTKACPSVMQQMTPLSIALKMQPARSDYRLCLGAFPRPLRPVFLGRRLLPD